MSLLTPRSFIHGMGAVLHLGQALVALSDARGQCQPPTSRFVMAVLQLGVALLCTLPLNAQVPVKTADWLPAEARQWLNADTLEGTAEFRLENEISEEDETRELKGSERTIITGQLRLKTLPASISSRHVQISARGTWFVEYDHNVLFRNTQFDVASGQRTVSLISGVTREGRGHGQGYAALTLHFDSVAGHTYALEAWVSDLPVRAGSKWSTDPGESDHMGPGAVSFRHFTQQLPVSRTTALIGEGPNKTGWLSLQLMGLGYGGPPLKDGLFIWAVSPKGTRAPAPPQHPKPGQPPTTPRCAPAPQQPGSTTAGKYSFPVKVSLTQPMRDTWGGAREYRRGLHRGVDIYVPEGSEVSAVVGGKVQPFASNPDAGGTMLFIQDKDGNEWGYMHLQGYAASIKPGSTVETGALLGYSGRTGIKRSGPHLHVDVKDWRVYRAGKAAKDQALQDKAYWNPYPLLKEAHDHRNGQSCEQ